MENAYFDSSIYICPDCDYKWSHISVAPSIASQRKPDFKKLANLNEPFFKLEHGKLYDCKIEHDRDVENLSIIPLAFERERNRQFVMIDARNLFAKNPDHVYDIIKMDFDYIMNDGIRSDYPSDYEALTVLCATKGDGTIVDYDDVVYFDFRVTNEI